jgi:hypothetical protein
VEGFRQAPEVVAFDLLYLWMSSEAAHEREQIGTFSTLPASKVTKEKTRQGG